MFIEYAFKPIKLKRIQKTIARAIGNCWDIKIVFSRGAGKTWLAAICAFALCCLYPGTKVIIVSATVEKAKQTLAKLEDLADLVPNLAAEIDPGQSNVLVHMNKDGGYIDLKNGSHFEAVAILGARSKRAKIVIRDEEREIDQDRVREIVEPLRNYTRDIANSYGFQDYMSKSISLSSACEQSNPYYGEFMLTFNRFKTYDYKNRGSFACCLDYHCAVDNGINMQEYFDEEREKFPKNQYDQEFGSIFLPSVEGSVFPYDLTNPIRTLEKVELAQSKSTTAHYVIGVDIATSSAKVADNSIIAVLKYHELQNGKYARKLVYMQSFHGQKLDDLARRVQELYHLYFPNTEKIVFDARGVGDAFARFCNNEFIDLDTGKEYPPLVVDDEPNYNNFALPILHPFRAIQTLNQRLYTNMLVAIEQKLLEIPVNSRTFASNSPKTTGLEKYVYIETDELQREMSYIVRKEGVRGATYDTPSNKFHKDRYSAVAMANDYIAELEKENSKHSNTGLCLGFVSNF